ncbi:uncharacterized protein LOC128875360 [Hylaeus volcanicus]|uniref:uncharacterized protein LOC128875360 n=1 Tax=Hylaeus volcanicus TaxID=313075 RepID=UPI0023B7A1D6|nr:uncharacterized protein LOC128875360 [Hylaeus volcanicus]
MLNVVEPWKFVLTLQSIPPFVLESVFALTLAVLLAVPLILQVQQLFDGPVKSPSRRCSVRRGNYKAEKNHAVVTHYPASGFNSGSSSSADLHLGSARRTISTPNMQASGDNVGIREALATRQNDNQKTDPTSKRNELAVNQSSSFIVTSSTLPIVDISAFDYDAYRHKLIDAALRKRYDDYQPPGDVVLNSIHLNTNDSTVAVRLNDRYCHSFFDFVEEYYDATKGMSKKETEYLHPLDHFLVKGTQKLETTDRETETRPVSVVHNSTDLEEKAPRISFYDESPVANSFRQKRQHNEDLDSIMKKSSKASKIKLLNAGVASSITKRPTFPCSARKKSATKFPRTTISTDSVSSKQDTLFGSQKRANRGETLSSIDGGERESMNCTTISSIDSESVRSESSKHRDDQSCISRDSFVASEHRAPNRSQTQPWMSGNPRTSFNKKYAKTAKISSKALETTRNGSILRSSSTRAKLKSGKQSVQSKNGAVENRNSGKTWFARRSDCKSDQLGRLEVIPSETQEMVNANTLSMNMVPTISSTRTLSNLSGHPSRTSPKFVTETAARVQTPKSINSPMEEAPAEQKKPADSEFPSKQSRVDKFARRYRDARQRSRTVSPVLAKPAAPRRELSMNLSPPKDELGKNAPASSDANKNTERKELTNEDAREYERKLSENRRPRAGTNLKSNFEGKGNTIDSGSRSKDLRSKEEENVAKLTSDFNRRRAAGATKHLTTTPRSGFSTDSKFSSTLKIQQQRIAGSKVSTNAQDSVAGVLQGRSSKSPFIDRRSLKTAKSEKTEPNRGGTKVNGPEGLKLPRRNSKAGIAMQTGLKKYIKKLKRVLSDRDNADIGELASLSITDAILPDLESTLSSIEVQHVQTLLNMAEKKSDLMRKDLSVLGENTL